MPATNKITDRLAALFLRRPEYFRMMASSTYPFSEEQIEKYKDDLVWDDDPFEFSCGNGLCNNGSLAWAKRIHYLPQEDSLTIQKSIDSMEKYEDRLNWNNMYVDWTNGLSRSEADNVIDTVIRLIR